VCSACAYGCVTGISGVSDDEREQDGHASSAERGRLFGVADGTGEEGLDAQGVGMLTTFSACKKKGYNHHARAHFDRARAFALQVCVCICICVCSTRASISISISISAGQCRSARALGNAHVYCVLFAMLLLCRDGKRLNISNSTRCYTRCCVAV